MSNEAVAHPDNDNVGKDLRPTAGPAVEDSSDGARDVPVVPRRFTPRRVFLLVAFVLFVALVALIINLLLLRPATRGVKADAQGGGTGLESVLVLTGPGTGPNPLFTQPMSAAWGSGGRIYVADTGNNRVVVFNRRGKFLFQFGSFGIAKPLPGSKPTWKPGSLNYPTGIAIDRENGDVYVADFYNNTVEVFDGEGHFLRNFPDPNKVVGKGGSGINGTGIAVTDVAVLDGKIYATDAFQVLVFDRSGKLLRQFGKPGAAEGDLDRPNGIVAAGSGTIVVADSNHSRLTRYDALGRPTATVGEQVRSVGSPTKNPFVVPRGLAMLDDGSIIVADPPSMDLVRVAPDGTVSATYGERGDYPAQFNFPNDVDADGSLLLVADRGNDRVQVVRMVGE